MLARFYSLIVLCFTVFAYGESHRYSLEGEIALRIYKVDGSLGEEKKRDFAVSVDNCRWVINTTNRDASGKVTAWWAVSSTNEGEVVTATYYPAGHVTAIVESNSFPTACEDSVSHYLWLMFASECFLAGVTDDMLPPVFDPVLTVLFDKDLRYKAIYDLVQAPLKLPREIIFLNDGNVRTWDPQARKTVLHKYSHPYDKGFTNAVFTISGLTNVGEALLPTGFSFLEFAPGANPDAPDIKRSILARVTKAEWNTLPVSSLPPLTKRAVVQDRRLIQEKAPGAPVTYGIQDKQWKTAEDVREIYELQKRKQASTTSKMPIGTILLALIVPLAVIFLWKKESARIRKYLRSRL